MLNPKDSHRATDVGHREAFAWPVVVALALAVIGPFALWVAIAVLVALAG